VENKEMQTFIKKDLAKNGKIATGAYTKLVALLPVAEDLIQFM
jgi:hypothetical protein